MVSAVGHISGGHFNPAVTAGFLITRRIKPKLAVVYWIAQLGGAVAAALLVKWLIRATRSQTASRASIPSRQARQPCWKPSRPSSSLGGLCDRRRPAGTFKSIAGLAIGLTITMDIFAIGPWTGAAMNPRAHSARSSSAVTGQTAGSGTSDPSSEERSRRFCTNGCTSARSPRAGRACRDRRPRAAARRCRRVLGGDEHGGAAS
jgi:glycerol uptake facilitator-like aquaporin